MRPTSPSNRISAHYGKTDGLSAMKYPFPAGHYRSTHHQQVGHRRRIGGRVAGIVASVLQLAVSALCVVGALSTWLGYPVGISLTTAVFMGGLLFGTISLLQLYSVLTDAASEEMLVAYDEART
jgi:hypothetical protein